MVGKILPLVMALLLIVGAASAMTPMPVGVQIINEGKIGGYGVEQHNLRTGEIVTFVTLSDGFNSFEWSNAQLGWAVGDDIKITLLDCATNPACVRTVKIEPTPTNAQIGIPITVTFDLTGEVCPVCQECPACPEKSCGTCGVSGECICPSTGDLVCPSDTTPYGRCDSCCAACKQCEVCELCEECEQCPVVPEDTSELLLWILGSAGAGAVVVVGYLLKVKVGRRGEDPFSQELSKHLSEYSGVRYFMKNGTVLVKHVHKGILGYHSPDIEHMDPTWRHEKGRLLV